MTEESLTNQTAAQAQPKGASRLLISVFLMPALYAIVARPKDKLEV